MNWIRMWTTFTAIFTGTMIQINCKLPVLKNVLEQAFLEMSFKYYGHGLRASRN